MKAHIPVAVLIVGLLIGVPSLAGIPGGIHDASRESCVPGEVRPTADGYDMVVIAPALFSDALQPLIDHKNSHGIETFLQTTDAIYDAYEGRDRAEQVKYYIKDAIEQHNVTYVLLVGGRVGQRFKTYVPMRYANVDDDYTHKQILSDLYFADIYRENGDFEDWDENGNGVFAEWTGNGMAPDDKMDL
ncbi:MAG: C25 family cysteine peptidase, partial [Thermoplasmatota archaeon]